MAKYIYLEYIDPDKDDAQTFSILHVYNSMKVQNGLYTPYNLYVKYPYMVRTVSGNAAVPSRYLTSTLNTNMINANDPLYLYNKSDWIAGSTTAFRSNFFPIEFKIKFEDIFKDADEIESLQKKYKDGLKVIKYAVNRWIYTNTNKSHKQLSQIKWCEQTNNGDLILKTWKRNSESLWEANLYVIADDGNFIQGHNFVLYKQPVYSKSSDKSLSDLLSFVFQRADSYEIINTSFLEVRLKPETPVTTIAKYGEYDIGSEATGLSNGCCFYCNDYTTYQHLHYPPSWIKSPFLTIKSSKTHSCKIHGTTPIVVTDSVTGSVTESYNSSLTYPPRNTGEPLPAEMSLSNATRLDRASIGTYVDGVARTPFLMLELRASDDAEKGYNISIPANSIVSFNHERHMKDTYNTFTLQIFDKDAMEVEAKLLLGFRTVVFYYTDFTSKSRRYKGLILDYKTTIVNKGIMLTITGYSTNLAKSYIGKDSIPWSILCEANNTSFYYWMNEAGEYHGEVHVLKDGSGEIYNSSEGPIVTPSYTHNDMQYKLKAENPNATGDNDRYRWVSYSEYYKDYPDQKTLDYFRPTPHLYRLSEYNENLARILSLNRGFNLEDRRPSDIVKLICIINNWSYNIVQTKKCSEIPDQVSMSYIEYIKEKLIPISVSEGSLASGNYLFYFDDNGVAHYEPCKVKEGNDVKKLYFNSVEHKDSYPLIGFTSSSNGSVLMAVNAKNSMEAINAFTGDALSLSSIVDVSDDPKYLGAVIETSEWYSTSKLMQDKDTDGKLDYVKLVTWQNKNTLPSETELRNELVNRWGQVAMYTWRAQLEVYGITDLLAGDTIDIYIYLDEGARTSDPVSKEIKVSTNDDGSKDVKYKGNLTMHHSSGRYIIHKINDQISGGRCISSMEVLKIDSNKVNELISFDVGTQSEKTEKTVVN